MAEQEKAAASQSALTHAAQAPNTGAASVLDMTVTAEQPGLAPHLGPASSLTAESSDSWATAFTEASQTLPGSNGMPDGSAASESAADAAQTNAAILPSGDGKQPSLHLQTTETQEHVDSALRVLPATPTDGPEHATEHLQPSKAAAEDADAAGSRHPSRASSQNGVSSARTGPGGHSQTRLPPGSIDWSPMDFDFGAPGSPVSAAEPALQQAGLAPNEAGESSTVVEADADQAHGLPEEAPGSSSAVPEGLAESATVAQHADDADDWDFGDFAEATASVPDPSLNSAAVGGLPVLDLQSFQEPLAAGSIVEPPSAPPEASHLEWDKGSLAISSNAAVVSIESADAGDGWGGWDASEAAGDSSAAVTSELGGAPSLAAGLTSPKLSAQLAPGGSGVLSFDQWGRAYSKLEQQAAKTGAGKQPAATPKAADTPAADADTFADSETSWGASQASAADVWASLAALDNGHAFGDAADSASSQPPVQHACTAQSVPSYDALTDPFAAFDSVAEDVEFAPTAGRAAVSTEGKLLSLPMPAMDSNAASWSAEDESGRDQPPQQAPGPERDDIIHASAAGSADRSQQALQADKDSAGEPPSFTAQRSWGDGWADCVADSMAPLPAQAAQAPDTGSSWKRQEEELALEKALGCDRQTALLCLAQV